MRDMENEKNGLPSFIHQRQLCERISFQELRSLCNIVFLFLLALWVPLSIMLYYVYMLYIEMTATFPFTDPVTFLVLGLYIS